MFAGIELTSQRVRRLQGANWATGVDRPIKWNIVILLKMVQYSNIAISSAV